MSRQPYAAALLGGLLGVGVAAGQQPSPPITQPRPPVFRAGAHYVRVDAYPTKDGKIVEGLTKDDFEIYEDGTLQAIEGSEFITFDTWTPEAERKDPRTQQDAYDLAADPNWRVFVIVIDRAAYGMEGQHYMRGPLHQFIDRNLGPRDLFGLLTTQSEWTDLTLGQSATAANAVLDSREWLYQDDLFDERWQMYDECGLGSMIERKKLDDTFTLFEGLVKLLGLIRQEKKSIVFVSNGLATPGTATASRPSGTPLGIPGIPVAPPGAPGGGPRIRPPTGGGNGPVGPMGHGDRIAAPSRQANCDGERIRLAGLDFGQRFRDLLRDARAANVAFYPVSPSGLQGMPFFERGGIDMAAYHAQNARTDTLRSLASETDGIAIVNTNDLAGGMRRIADDIRAYYVLGYYTTNTTWDGKPRSIKVRLKPKRDTIRARRQYRAPTLAEIAALSAAASPGPPASPSAEDVALASLSTARPSARFWSYAARAGQDLAIVLEIPGGAAGAPSWPAGAEVQALAETAGGDVIGSARAKLGAGARGFVVHLPLEPRGEASTALIRVRSEGMVLTDRLAIPAASALIGDPIAYRNGRAVAVLDCTRTDGLRFEWPVLAALDRREARLLDRKGRPLSIGLPLLETTGPAPVLAAELALAPLARGEYLVEIVASGAGTKERKLMALRVR